MTTRWLDAEENQAWREIWAVMTWLPTSLDAQLRADAGLSLAEYNALSQMSEAPQRTVRLSALAAATNMTLSHLSRVITRLEEAGWVRRSPDPTDRRATLGTLTDEGWQKVVAVAPGHVQTVRRLIFDHFTPRQTRELGEYAGRIADAVHPKGL